MPYLQYYSTSIYEQVGTAQAYAVKKLLSVEAVIMAYDPNIPVSASLREFFRKLRNGEFSLAQTFWVYGLVGKFIYYVLVVKGICSQDVLFRLYESFGESGLLFIVGTIESIYVIYFIHVLLGMWRASDKYTGNQIWAVLAKIYVVLGTIMILRSIFVDFLPLLQST